MKNSALFLRSILIVAIIAGIPHALRVYSGTTDTSNLLGTETVVEPSPSIEQKDTTPAKDEWRPYWVGKYEVTYEEMKEKTIHEIRDEKGTLKCYSVGLIDANGNRFDDNTLIMKEISTEQEEASALYEIEYEGEKFNTQAKLSMDEDGNIVLTYDYYGYKGKEIWTRIQ